MFLTKCSLDVCIHIVMCVRGGGQDLEAILCHRRHSYTYRHRETSRAVGVITSQKAFQGSELCCWLQKNNLVLLHKV